MLLPLGLGLFLPRIPWATLALALGLLGYFIADVPAVLRIPRQTAAIYARHRLPEATEALFLEYCRRQRGAEAICARHGRSLKCVYRSDGECPKEARSKGKEHDGIEEILRGSQIVARFVDALGGGSRELATLTAYPAYLSARDRSYGSLGELQRDLDLFSPANQDPWALWLAQFKHAGALHLFGNLFTLIVFGSYVELRIGAVRYLITYLLGGLVGLGSFVLFFPESPNHIVGASANISALMGVFFVLFFPFRMKFLAWAFYTGRTFFAPVSIFFPLLFLLTELVGALESRSQLFGGVAHTAHLMGLAVGVGMALIEKALRPLPWPFIYRGEAEKTRQLAAIADLGQRIPAAEKLIRHNPENIYARYSLIREICLLPAEIPPAARAFVVKHLAPCIAILRRRRKMQGVCELLGAVPPRLSFAEVLPNSGRQTLMSVGDYALEIGAYPVALRLYDACVRRYPRSRDAAGVLKTIEKIREHAGSDPRLRAFIAELAKHDPQSRVAARPEESIYQRRKAHGT